ncbi:MAG TPA: glycosyltransferase family 2 protein [Candidatus Saccharimonadales bacterium]|nr:glycosyltransferase family 2 protein [Candidatus Saccharimonadales bacterium]
MKLVIFIPCLNEEETLPLVLRTIPKHIPGIDNIEILLVDDGSTDRTVEVAKQLGVKQFLHHTVRQGLSRTFRHGLNRALELGADIIVMTEGDNQYKQERISELIQPILDGKADIVIADRMTQTIKHFSPTKKLLQKLGTRVLNVAAGTNVPDAISGFRAYTRSAAMQLNPVADYSWATETTIQASRKKLAIVSIPIETNPKLRDSRQFKSSWQHVRRSSITIVRGFIMYKPYAIFLSFGLTFLVLGLVPFVRYLILYLTHNHPGQHLQSLIIGSVLLIASFISFALGLIADLIRINRSLLEDILEGVKKNAS